MAVTLRFQSSGAVPGDGHPITMRGPSLTIGRGPENDVVLPDPDRMISKTHCVIENHNGSVVVVDFSTNGTFLNYGKVALGRIATPINDGDVLIMGPYEFAVEITASRAYSDQAPPVLGERASFGEPLAPLPEERASFGNAKSAPDPYKLLDDAGPGGDFLDGLLGGSKPTGPSQFRKMQEPVDLLPPLGDDGPLLAPRRDLPSGPAMRDHSASITDNFRPAQTSTAKSVIPDDWDDLLAPTPQSKAKPQMPLPANADVYSHAPAARSAAIPDDDMFDAPATPLPPASVVPAVDVSFGGPIAAPNSAAAIPAAIPEDDFLELPLSVPTDPAVLTLKAPPVAVQTTPDIFAPQTEDAQSAPPIPQGDDALATDQPTTAAPFDPFATDPNRPSRNTAVPAQSAVVEVVPLPVISQAAATVSGPVTNADAARAFLMAVGAEDIRITDAELPDTMARLGRTLKSMITGLREILMTRTSIKSEFRIEQTMVNVGGNNPLKFSVTPEQAIEAMVKPTARGYLPAEAAALQALEDIKAHEIAMMTGMEAALKGVLAKLNPASLTTKIEAKGGFGGFLKNRKAQYWETYEAMYADISSQAENDFHELFAKEFSQAYRAQLARLKDAKARSGG